ncbi:carbamoyltransferase HypF [Campylobacter sp. RM12327]|uniref:carbamoyltransferase HypF n=1 Tax=Campylobacter sputorum TaxID=206 RepID=UPI000B78FABE|nr:MULTISPECIES: carbamoyltransferase HypF [Campylobacter]MBE7357414.1 carbamoyltransferase HypF [Campylobacter sp. RM11302]MBF6668724.1 carbamoyltransferase HypF [Campylobacter sp. RM12327]MBF6674730.1 carbamoyltransferase HypF [Campylobacter sp. RM13538]MBF6675953.1 carbamoyltransferase HypF [Campylobacter sp. RM12321]MBF6677789.1 carbamoyltransferase HypF [Campylobacter sp. RM11259]
MTNSQLCYEFDIRGLVQGVGFRPFVYKIATDLCLKGEVYNDSEGVKLTLQASKDEIDNFFEIFYSSLPPLCKIHSVKKIKTFHREFTKFTIIASKSAKKISPILPDFAICNECKAEFYNKNNARYHYPFINCTNCGPRISIIKDLPYDRINTTMSKFKMCKFCESEYTNPLNRRYHAQPISCPNCGPSLYLKDKNGNILKSGNDAIKLAAKALQDGKIIAIKGLSGFHLCVDALNQDAIKKLRIRKHRPFKPFAIMCKDLDMAKNFANINTLEEKELDSNLKPIVILNLKKDTYLPQILAPNLNKVGIFLANTGVHLLLFEYFKNPIIATSANISGEPIIYDELNLISKLDNIFDFYLDNNRDILNPGDDSILQVIDNQTMFLRTSRGVNPQTIKTNSINKKTILALGGELKNQFAIYKNSQIFISPYIGDLKNVATFKRFISLLDMFVKTYKLKFDEIIGDLHPHFLHTKYFEKNRFNIKKIGHHKAHVYANIFEFKLEKKDFLAFCFDGTGYGEDKKIWGGEIFLYKNRNLKRVLHFKEFKLLGGENAIKNIWQIAYSLILSENLENIAEKFLSKFDQMKLINLKKIYEKNINSPLTTSAGRLFDAFASIICGINEISYEGHSGMQLEALYDENLDVSYKFEILNDEICYKTALINALKDDKKVAATAFINAFSNLIAEISLKYNLEICFSGGVFQNKTLLKATTKLLKKANLTYHIPKFPPNDSSIAIGQMQWYLSHFKDKNNTI